MEKNKLFVSTIADDGLAVAQTYGLQLELAEFCTASNMDQHLSEVEPQVFSALRTASHFVFHAPFNELYPAAIDPKAVDLAHFRLNQALELALSYGIRRIVVHSGHVPQLYFPEWFEERAVLFWRDFLRDKPSNILLCMENVLEDEPTLLYRVVEAVADPRLSLCLDVGHANRMSRLSPLDWLRADAQRLDHFHLHNNDGTFDQHNGLPDGSVDMRAFLTLAAKLCPYATYTIETLHAEPSVHWLLQNGFLQP